MWKQIDADGNNALTEQELRYAMKNKSISKKLSHLICLHTSEWSYKESKLSSLKNKLNTLFDEGIKEEEDAACKQELKDKRKAVLDAMEARVKNLSWWKEVKDNALFGNNPFSPGAAKKEKKEAAKPVEIPFAPEEELKGPTLFPDSKPKVYHFHPLAFVRQMRRMARSNEIHIYHTGHISKTDLTKAETVIYIYHDKDGGIHELGEFPIVWTQKWAKGSYTKGTEGKWKTITNDGKTRHYQYDGDNKSPLMTPYSLSDGRKVYNYRKNDIKIAINEATDREYYNPEAFATVLGALADGDFTDIVSNGSVDVDGTGAFSVSHINGINMDFKYLRTDKKKGYIDNNIKRILVNDILLDIPRQNQLLNSLYKFGWGVLTKNLSNKTRENKELNHCKSEDHHKDHLHIQGFSPKYK